MKLWSCLVLGAAILASVGCGKKEIAPLQRKQAANFVSEAQFAVTLRDYPRAEGLLVKAADLTPDAADIWLNLGTTRMRMGQRDAARTAYKRALQAFAQTEKAGKNDTDSALQQVYVLALLGRIDDARALQAKLQKRYPNDRDVRVWVEQKRLDRMIADPAFKQFAL